MNTRFDEELFLTTETGRHLYHKYAEHMRIIDYHCHLQPSEILEDKEFEDLGEMWLRGDHYKWRAMRTFGIDERYITGDADFHEKYLAFASILPALAGNPIYIWCAMELKRYFDIDEPVTEENAEEIHQKTKEMIHKEHMTSRWCMEHSNGSLDQLEAVSGVKIDSFEHMLDALETRLKYFQEVTGTTVSDDGIPHFTWENYTSGEIDRIFDKARKNEPLTAKEEDQYRSAFLF